MMMTMHTDSLLGVVEESQSRLHDAALMAVSAKGVAARGNATATLAQESMFAEAMLAAMHARFAEGKEVTRS